MEKASARKRLIINFVLVLITVAGLSGTGYGATFTVTKTADTNDGICDADCSLREAIAAANAVNTDDTINFDANIFSTAQTITLGGNELVIGAVDYQPTPITENLTINGTGANLLTISGNNASRVFAIYRVISTIRGISVTGGNGDGGDNNYDGRGGAIFSAGGIFNLTDSTVKGSSTQQGGGIYLFGTCNLTNVTVTNNTSTNGGTSGGGIHSFGALTLLNSTVSNNLAHGIGGGIESSANLTLTNTSVTGNTSYTNGGGVHQSANGAFNTYTNSNISNNTAIGIGGGLRAGSSRTVFTNSIVSNNTAESGGGIFANSTSGNSTNGKFIFNSSILSENRASSVGGGIFTGSGSNFQYEFDNSTISGNTAGGTTFQDGGGGGVYNSFTTMVFNNTTISNNSAIFNGGGISSYGFLTFTNSTVSGNSANNGGGIYSYNRATTGTAQTVLTNTTIAKNIAGGSGGGIINIANNSPNIPSAILQSKNSIIADNAANAGSDLSGAFVSQGYNLIENSGGMTGSSPTDIIGVDPQLLPLGSYGGATRTHALNPSSPAIDKGSSFGVTADQRGQIRPFDNLLIPNSPGGDASDIGSFERQTAETLIKTAFDYDGDGKADLSVFRPSNGVWYLSNSASGFSAVAFGVTNDLIAPADFDGDEKTDVSVFRSGTWYRLNSSDGAFSAVSFGTDGDLPVPADFDGDGKADLNVFRPSNGTWYRLNSSNGAFVGTAFGTAEDKPVIGDFDGDGKADIAIFRPSNGVWYRLNSSNGSFTAVGFGNAEDKPVAADYDGDGKTDLAVFRPSNGTWYRLNSSNNQFVGTTFGTTDDLPVAADYDGDGKADIGVFRPSNGTWYLLKSVSGFSAQTFGANGDIPTPNAFVR